MINYEVNPFQELYVTDSPDPKAFVALFSAFPVRHALALFRPGNVVLKGSQGAGKSMLLNLFRTQIRLAYHSAAADFPVPEPFRQFVSAGINLTRSGILDIGNRPLSRDSAIDDALFPLYFADFLNYYVVRDILNSVEVMRNDAEVFNSIIAADRLDDFARNLARDGCWFGALSDCSCFVDLCSRLDQRIDLYRGYHLYNIKGLPSEIDATKTNIGEPIAQTAELLRSRKVISSSVPVFVRIDQVERLYRSDSVREAVGPNYRRMVNKLLGMRDSRVWYRVGTRRYAWEDDLVVFGSKDRLEHLRDFRVIDLDKMLKRKEDSRTWIFPEFAADAFTRRLEHCAYEGTGDPGLIRRVFGPPEDPAVAAKRYAGDSQPQRIMRHEEFPAYWKDFLDALFVADPLSAVLAAAWARQRGANGESGARLQSRPPANAPWNRLYWRKERVRQALTQIAARAAQRLKWSGDEQILALSAGNISIFLSICHEIWEAFLRAERRRTPDQRRNPVTEGFHPNVQAVGIQTASVYWHEKITEQPNGDDRRRFVTVIAAKFRSWLLDDESMSNPGRNGFSLSVDDLAKFKTLQDFLRDSSDYGDLYEVPHTTKEKSRKQRKKWYVSPILSVYYQLPESHPKEPYYATVDQVAGWTQEAEIALPGLDEFSNRSLGRGKKPTDPGRTLFDDDPDLVD